MMFLYWKHTKNQIWPSSGRGPPAPLNWYISFSWTKGYFEVRNRMKMTELWPKTYAHMRAYVQTWWFLAHKLVCMFRALLAEKLSKFIYLMTKNLKIRTKLRLSQIANFSYWMSPKHYSTYIFEFLCSNFEDRSKTYLQCWVRKWFFVFCLHDILGTIFRLFA